MLWVEFFPWAQGWVSIGNVDQVLFCIIDRIQNEKKCSSDGFDYILFPICFDLRLNTSLNLFLLITFILQEFIEVHTKK